MNFTETRVVKEGDGCCSTATAAAARSTVVTETATTTATPITTKINVTTVTAATLPGVIRLGNFCSTSNVHKRICLYKRCSPSSSDLPDDDNSAVEALTAKELNALSIQERERIFEEVNGIPRIVEEDPDVVTKCLFDLDQAIEQIQIDRSAYDRAMMMRPDLRNDIAFRLMFVRADYFDPRKAARRMVKYFDSKLKLFGEDKLVKRITYEDLSTDDRKALMTGTFQILRSKDRAGRSVLFSCARLNTAGEWQNHFRCIWYQIMALLEYDVNVQRKGIVIVIYNVGMNQVKSKFRDLVKNVHMLNEALPYRIGGIHYCYQFLPFRPFMLLFQFALGTSHRLRFRSHYGTNIECQYSLTDFGIPPEVLPIETCGMLKKEELLASIEERKRIEKQQQAQGKMDVSEQTSPKTKEKIENGIRRDNVDIDTRNKYPENVEIFNTMAMKASDDSKLTSRLDSTETRIRNQQDKQPVKVEVRKEMTDGQPASSCHKTSSEENILFDNEIRHEDVLIGVKSRHPGNVQLFSIIARKANDYSKASSRLDKTLLSLSIVDSVKASNGRFLRRSGRDCPIKGWIKLDDFEARDIVSHRLRNASYSQAKKRAKTTQK